MAEGSASIVINRPASEVFDAITDITRMGEWSPECTGGRWLDPATGPAVGAKFEGDNAACLGPLTLKRWTTTSEITECTPDRVFEFVAEGHTTWRYELTERDGATSVTESFGHEPYVGWQKYVYGMLGQREKGMVKGMKQTLARMKTTLET
ncbi:MAG: SRPBCC family protein [Acidimicrobiia bacterium]|nr:SRPBCC family protein [Acidimicrobiia bacterium]